MLACFAKTSASGKNMNMKKILVTFYILVVLFFSVQAQTTVPGKYFALQGMMENELTLRKNHSFKLRAVNWESGHGGIYYGKWILKNDTILILEYTYFRFANAAEDKDSNIRGKHATDTNLDTLIVSEGSLCFVLPVNEDCYKKKD